MPPLCATTKTPPSHTSRKLLEDRKPPFAHLTPRRLAFTFVKSGLVVAAPLANEVVLENLDDWVSLRSFAILRGVFVKLSLAVEALKVLPLSCAYFSTLCDVIADIGSLCETHVHRFQSMRWACDIHPREAIREFKIF